MPEPIKISTDKFNKQGKVEVDGNIWSIKLPGAGTELRLSQAMRASKLNFSRMSLIEKKIDKDTATEEDLDRYEQYSKAYEDNEQTIYNFFLSVFDDGTPDNSAVEKWVKETPSAVIQLAFEDIKSQANGTERSTEESSTPEEAK